MLFLPLLSSTALVALSLLLLPSAVVVQGQAPPLPSIRPGRGITVSHNIDLVALSGYTPVGLQVRVEVQRNGTVVGFTEGATVAGPDGIGLEINHGPEGVPQTGDCWMRPPLSVVPARVCQPLNPDIQPGDRIVVTDANGRDEVVVDDIRFTGQPFQLAGGPLAPIHVPFAAFDAAGAPIPAAELTLAEFRQGSPLRYRADEIDIVPDAAAGAGNYFMRYAAPFTPARNRDGLTQAQVAQALLGTGHIIGRGDVEGIGPGDAGGVAMLVEGTVDVTGPAAGCPLFLPLSPCTGADLTFDAAALQAPGSCPSTAVPGSLLASGFSCTPGCVAGASCTNCGGLTCADGVWSATSSPAVCVLDQAPASVAAAVDDAASANSQ